MVGFNHMPAEVRNSLYAEVFQQGEPHCTYRHITNPHALFTVSRQLHKETTSYFYQHNVIVVDTFGTLSDATTILPPIANKYLRFLRRLEIHAPVGQGNMQNAQGLASTIEALATMGANFDELTIRFSSKLSSFLNSRVEDSILDADHPITTALQRLLRSNVVKLLRLELKAVWFAAGVAHTLRDEFGSQLCFVDAKGHTVELDALEKPLLGRYSSMHLTALDLAQEYVLCSMSDTSSTTSTSSAPTSLTSSLCLAFADLDTFAITPFESGCGDGANKVLPGSSLSDGLVAHEEPFFTEDDVEEWMRSAGEYDDEDDAMQDVGALEDVSDLNNEKLEVVPQEDLEAIMVNLEESAHHIANEADITYMTNYAPDLLLTQHQLGHLV